VPILSNTVKNCIGLAASAERARLVAPRSGFGLCNDQFGRLDELLISPLHTIDAQPSALLAFQGAACSLALSDSLSELARKHGMDMGRKKGRGRQSWTFLDYGGVGTFLYYLRDALQEGSADVVTCLPVPRA